MDFRKHKEEDVAGKERRARTWDVRMSTLPTSYARLARAARSLGDIGVPARRPDQVMVGRERGVGYGPGAGREQGTVRGPGTWHGPAVCCERGVVRGPGTGRELGAGREQGTVRELGAVRGLSTSRELGAGSEQGVAHSPGVRLDVVA